MRSVAMLLAVASCAAVVVAGCGGVSLDPVEKAAAATQDEQTMKLDFEFSATTSDGTVKGVGSGVFDNQSRRGRFELHTTGGGQDISIEEVSDGLVMYMKSPMFGSELPQGKHWVKIDVQKTLQQKGVDTSTLTARPDDLLAQLTATSGGVEKVGTEQVEGVDTTHYRATISYDKAAENAKDEQTAQSYRKLAELVGSKTVPVDVWIDGDDHVRKLTETMTIHEPRTGQDVETTTTTTFVDFGAPVQIDVPPADEVVDETSAAAVGVGG